MILLRKLKKKKDQSIKKKFIYNLSINYNIYQKFLSVTFKFGKKNLWNSYFSNILEILQFKLKYCVSILLLKIFVRLYTKVELKKIKSKKRITYIPFSIKYSRSLFLSLKWIFFGALKNLDKISFKNKLYIELFQLLTLKKSYSFQKLKENNLNALKFKANTHYRWNY